MLIDGVMSFHIVALCEKLWITGHFCHNARELLQIITENASLITDVLIRINQLKTGEFWVGLEITKPSQTAKLTPLIYEKLIHLIMDSDYHLFWWIVERHVVDSVFPHDAAELTYQIKYFHL